MLHLPENKITCGAVKYSRYMCVRYIWSGSVCGWMQMCCFSNWPLFHFSREKRGSEPDKDIQLARVYGRPLHQSEHGGAGWHMVRALCSSEGAMKPDIFSFHLVTVLIIFPLECQTHLLSASVGVIFPLFSQRESLILEMKMEDNENTGNKTERFSD